VFKFITLTCFVAILLESITYWYIVFAAMLSFLQHCRELITEDVIRRLLAPLECTLTMLAQ
jgi:hypothetical protein